MTPNENVIKKEIKSLLSTTHVKFRHNCDKTSSITEVFVDIENKDLLLNKIGLHILLNNFGQWIIYLSATFNRTIKTYEGMAFFATHVSESYRELIKWLTSRATVNYIYQDICNLTDSYNKSMWLDVINPVDSSPDTAQEPYYEVWYNELIGNAPLHFVERNNTLTKEIRRDMQRNKRHMWNPKMVKFGVFLTYALYPDDVLNRKEYIIRHNDTLERSIDNICEPILKDMQSVSHEICARALREFDPDKEINDFNDTRYMSGVRVQKWKIPHPDNKNLYSEEYHCWIRLQIPDGLFVYEQGHCETTDAVKEWLSAYSSTPWVIDKFTDQSAKKSYESCLEEAYIHMPSIYN